MEKEKQHKSSMKVFGPRLDGMVMKIAVYVLLVTLMANLGALVDSFLHDDIKYFDSEHLIVGGVTGLVTAVLFGAVALYTMKLENTVKRHRAAKLEAVESEKKYRDLLEETGDVVFIVSPGGEFKDINPAGAITFGYPSRKEMLDENIADLFVDHKDWNDLRQLLKQRGYVKNHELQMRRRNGRDASILMSVRRAKDPVTKEIVYRGTMHDVTSERRMAQQLLQSQKMESVGRLAGGVAHDFNNFLTSIQGYTDLVLMELPEGSLAKENLLEARKAAEAASELTSQLLLFSPHQPVDMRPVDLNRSIEGLSHMIERLVGPDTKINLNLAPDLRAVKGDIGNLSQVLVNLALNANIYMPGGGEINITTCNGKVEERYVESHPEARTGEFSTISVTDSSQGLSDEEIAHIFEPFSQPREKNSGLGLSMVYGVVMQHDGWIDVDSIPGMGTTFTVFLPSVEKLAVVEDYETDLEDLPESAGERILLVEDDDAVREITGKMLRENGYEVIGAHDAAEAFARFASERGDIQLVFSDVVLPGEDGIHLVENLREHKPELAVLLGSGYSDTAIDWQTVQSRGYRFMQKPYVMPDLLKIIRELLVPAA
ncbi:MAG: response regulator [Actinobacteria bacterium]|nr:response regulator [Actinomycetota bacterium]MCL5883414.1 response regulator [Actinomycetota bacterium]